MEQKLEAYRRKRNFLKTSEPSGKEEKPVGVKKRKIFAVQLHYARTTHFDFRLEWDGVLLSWAVPKGPSFNPKDKRLAVRVEEHPLDYADFEGVIPKGEYGGGTVLLWDKGYWTLYPTMFPCTLYRKNGQPTRIRSRHLHRIHQSQYQYRNGNFHQTAVDGRDRSK